MTDTDVLIVGGGPIGLAAAIEARLAGYDVVVVEPRDGPVDKACGEGLMPGALRALQALDVDPDGHVLRGISYRDAHRHADHLFTEGQGKGVRRTTLHAALAERAAALGATTIRGRVEQIDERSEAVTAAGISARWLLGCDGLHSTVRRLAGLEVGADAHAHESLLAHARHDPDAPGTSPGGPSARAAGQGGPGAGSPGSGGPATPRDAALPTPRAAAIPTELGGTAPPVRPGPDPRRRFGLRRHFRVPAWTDLVEVHWGDRVEAYVTPVAPDVVGIAMLGPTGTHFDEAFTGFTELSERLRDAEPLGPVRGAGPLRQRSRRRSTGRVRLVGDASGYVDALTGEGLRVGLAQASAVVGHLDDPDAYERDWTRVTRDYRVLTSGLVAWATSPARRAIVPLAAHAPWLYGRVVERLAR
ncbi:3-(3-hydroxy-phenyl)propionate/3-hydroxycinnamic acid hydroxylase [Oerskovia enterophila]|uniref:3-(3-hydroxy-phenyl)propionate/3-hydroxycinnamic acid hydroxylase n=1 Tax=Oerskovia enterophila TaxID=43678 RepID=A0A163SH34_9CELL|nr:3-(3-hydroxy-phenyl)propionate/3-hydroxycinnamic acid hydroxylase [Oerskovia enterophila]